MPASPTAAPLGRISVVPPFRTPSGSPAYRSDPRDNLQENGATAEEIKFLCSGRERPRVYVGHRVELNAFTSDAFIAWIEAKLQKHGIAKVIPDQDTVEEAYRRAMQIALVRSQLETIIPEARTKAEKARIPKDIGAVICERQESHPEVPWDQIVGQLAAENVRIGAPQA